MNILWDEIGRERYGITDAKMLRLRYGVQVNSLGLTEAQPENNIIRIALEALGVTLSKKARAALAAASGLERSPRPPAPLGPAALATYATNPRVRDRPARVRRSLRRLSRCRSEDRGAPRGGSSRAPAGSRHGRRSDGDRERVHEAETRREPHGPHPSHRVRRPNGRRRERVSGGRRLAARRRGIGLDPKGRRNAEREQISRSKPSANHAAAPT